MKGLIYESLLYCKKERFVKTNGESLNSYLKRSPRCHSCAAKFVTDKISKGWFKKGHKLGLGRKMSEATKKKISILTKGKHNSPNTEFKKGYIPYLKTHPEAAAKGINHHKWKGDKVGYFPLHDWVKRQAGKPSKCVNGHIAKRYVWANISGEYRRDINDWHELCDSCNFKDGVKINERFNL